MTIKSYDFFPKNYKLSEMVYPLLSISKNGIYLEKFFNYYNYLIWKEWWANHFSLDIVNKAYLRVQSVPFQRIPQVK